jgi:hypothetical protein
MSMRLVHLRKLIKVLYLEAGKQTSELRTDIRNELAREQGVQGDGGGDFHGPFWSDARDHVFNIRDLHSSVQIRVEANPRRARLYPLLRDGFLGWWNERRRWTNEPFRPAQSPHGRYEFPRLGIVKVENILAVRDAANAEHFVYPYFAELPILGDQAARLGLWLIGETLPHVPLEEIRILDVLRGRTFSVDRTPCDGREEAIFLERYYALLARWDDLRREY